MEAGIAETIFEQTRSKPNILVTGTPGGSNPVSATLSMTFSVVLIRYRKNYNSCPACGEDWV